MKIHKLFISLILIASLSGFGQSPGTQDVEPLIEEIVSSLSDTYDENTDFSDVASDLYYLNQHPVSINTADKKSLARLFFLSERQINDILHYVEFYGPVKTIYELQVIEGIPQQTLRWMSPFITFKQREISSENSWYVNHELLYRTDRKLQEQKGYIADTSGETTYYGSPIQHYLRYNAETQKFAAGITADKDAGEPFFDAPNNKGFDFYSGHFMARDLGFIQKAVLGDYKLQFGQGLTLWNGFSMGKSPTLAGVKKYGYGLKPYRSSNEATYLRGAAITTGWNSLTLTTFFSRKNWDANKVFDADSSDYFVTSLKEGGYHRTEAEWEDHHSLREIMGGGNISFDKKRWHFGITSWFARYNHRIEPADRLYNYFRFKGRKRWITGIDASHVFDNGEIYSEWSMDRNGDMAVMAGANLFLHPRLTLKTVYRNYDKAYNNIYSSGISEGSRINDEEGFLVGMVFLMLEEFSIKAYADFFRMRWMGFRTSSPSRGQEYSLQLNYTPSRKFNGYLRFQHERKAYNLPEEHIIQHTGKRNRSKIRVHASYELSESLTLKNRLEKSLISYPNTKSQGFLIYQDIRYELADFPLILTGRLAMFDTDDYASRLYAYENDVLYTFSFPAYYYQGERYYLLAKYEIRDGISAWLRYSRTRYDHKSTVLSGNNEIDGNAVGEVKFQVRVKF